jgi:flagellar export protein FliJ
MAFRFRFESLLGLALHEESLVKTRLALKDGQIAAETAQIERLVGEYDLALEDKAQALLTGQMDRVKLYPAFLRRLDMQRQYHEEERERFQQQREKILIELNEKRRVVKTYEKVREREEEAWRRRQLKVEQKRLDEFAIQRRDPLQSAARKEPDDA